jgi:hypothetical protein
MRYEIQFANANGNSDYVSVSLFLSQISKLIFVSYIYTDPMLGTAWDTENV